MPRIVDKVPNPWFPYMDGNIWEFTEDELKEMPRYMPMVDINGAICGKACMQWVHRGKIYIRFYGENDIRDPDYLAGWKEV